MAQQQMPSATRLLKDLNKVAKHSAIDNKRPNDMNLKLLLVLIVLSLAACAQTPVRDESPASDLDAYKANVHREGKIKTLPNGKEYCVEDSATEDALDNCSVDLEDALFSANRSIERLVEMADKFVERLKLARNPCGFWRGLFRPRDCKVEPYK